MNELTFNGIRAAADMGLRVRGRTRTILPEPVVVAEEIPGMDGDYDFSEVNPDGRMKYKPYVDEITFSLIADNMVDVIAKAHDIVGWLSCGQKQLIYDDDPGVYRLAQVINKLELESQLIKLKTLTVQFKCQPLTFGIIEETHTYSTSGDKAINNPGTYAKPKFTVTGSFTSLTLACGGKTITYSEAISGATLAIDCEKMSCVKDGAINKSNKLSGSFFEFANGNNVLTIGGTGLDCSITVSFRPRYL